MTTQTVTAEITFMFNGRKVQCDLGVPRSPVWTEVEDVYLDLIEFCGIEYDYNEMVEYFGQHGADGIIQQGRELINEDNWE